MSKLDKFFDGLKEAAGQMKEVGGKVWDALDHPMMAHGAQELAAAILGKNDGFIMYPRDGGLGVEQGKTVEGPEPPSMTPVMDRDEGMER